MELHKLLLRQIRKFLPDEIYENEKCIAFLKAVSDSYMSYERDQELSNHAFAISEQEYHRLNQELKTEVDARNISIAKLKEIIHAVNPEFLSSSGDDLVSIAEFVKDLSARQIQLEFESSKNIQRITSLISNLNSGILVENENREILFTNQNFCDMFGIPVPPEQLAGVDCSQSAEQSKGLFTDPEGFVQRVDDILKTQEQVSGEILFLQDGRTFERDFVPVYLDTEYKGHLWNYTDITERQQIQQALEESEARNRLIMNSALDAIVTFDSDGLITSWNPQAEKIFGWQAAEVMHQNLSNLILPEQFRVIQDKGIKLFNETGEGETFRKMAEFTAIHKEGHEFPVEFSTTPIHFIGGNFFCSFIRDISERKKSENALAASEKKYRSIIANMNLGLLEVDIKDNVQFCNQSFEQISGYSLEELKGKPAGLHFFSAEQLKILLEKNHRRQDGVSDSYEILAHKKSGESRWWLISGAPNYDEKGDIKGSIGVHLDITDQKRLEKELAVALQKAQEASKAKESFIANMSHEIRTPLNAIIGMIRELGREDLTPKQNSYLSHSDTAAKHLLSIVNNILDMSRIEAGEFLLENKEFSLSSVINMVQSILFGRAKEKGLTLKSYISPDIKPALIGDSGRIRQILINIIGNAIKFTEQGSVVLQVDVVQDDPKFQELNFLIKDTGIGMSKEYLEMIFEKFSQEGGSHNKKYEGTGLGMTITKQMINLMGSNLEITSEKGVGTTVTFNLTLPTGDLAKVISNHEIVIDNSLAGLQCLLVEDNEMNQLIVTQSLQHFGCVVTATEDGQKAIDALQDRSFDFILMDIQMPVLDGIEATRYIRETLHSKIPIIALTANAFRSDIDRYLSTGMNDYITKPYEEHQLFSIIANTLNIKTQSEASVTLVNSDDTGNSLYNLSKVYELSRGDHSFVNKIVKIFIEHTPTAIQEMKIALQRQDFETIGKLAHQMKPSITNMGIQRLINTFRELEAESKKTDCDGTVIEPLIIQAEEVIEKVISQLKRSF